MQALPGLVSGSPGLPVLTQVTRAVLLLYPRISLILSTKSLHWWLRGTPQAAPKEGQSPQKVMGLFPVKRRFLTCSHLWSVRGGAPGLSSQVTWATWAVYSHHDQNTWHVRPAGFALPPPKPESFSLGVDRVALGSAARHPAQAKPTCRCCPRGEAGLEVLGLRAAISPQPRSEWPCVRTKAGEWNAMSESCQHTQTHAPFRLFASTPGRPAGSGPHVKGRAAVDTGHT